MHKDMSPLLNAYQDGELHGIRLQELKIHLASCEICQGELKELGLISDMLHAAPSPEFMPAERFASNLALNLPRRTRRNLPILPGQVTWWLIPVGLLTALFFVQTIFTLTNLVTAANAIGLLGPVGSWFGGEKATIWFAAATSLFGGQLNGIRATLSWLNEVNVFGATLLTGFLWQALIVLLYWCWLFIWTRRHRQTSLNS
jgi:anti-sigma factor RsiW